MATREIELIASDGLRFEIHPSDPDKLIMYIDTEPLPRTNESMAQVREAMLRDGLTPNTIRALLEEACGVIDRYLVGEILKKHLITRTDMPLSPPFPFK